MLMDPNNLFIEAILAVTVFIGGYELCKEIVRRRKRKKYFFTKLRYSQRLLEQADRYTAPMAVASLCASCIEELLNISYSRRTLHRAQEQRCLWKAKFEHLYK